MSDENLNINARKSELNKNTLLKHFSLYLRKFGRQGNIGLKL